MRVVVDQWPHPYAKSSLSKQTRLWIEQLTFETGSFELSVNQFFQKNSQSHTKRQAETEGSSERRFVYEWARMGTWEIYSLARARAGAQNKFPEGHTPGSQFFFFSDFIFLA